MQTEPKFYIIEERVRDILIEYLSNRPMKEVEGGVLALRQLRPLETEMEKDQAATQTENS